MTGGWHACFPPAKVHAVAYGTRAGVDGLSRPAHGFAVVEAEAVALATLNRRLRSEEVDLTKVELPISGHLLTFDDETDLVSSLQSASILYVYTMTRPSDEGERQILQVSWTAVDLTPGDVDRTDTPDRTIVDVSFTGVARYDEAGVICSCRLVDSLPEASQ